MEMKWEWKKRKEKKQKKGDDRQWHNFFEKFNKMMI